MVSNPVSNFVDPFPHIPSELKNIVAWCVWQYQITPYGRTKVPRNPISHTHKADSTDPSTWVSYEVALANLQGYEGLGFFFSKSAGYTGVDLDDPFTRKDKSVILPEHADYEAAAKTSEQHGRIYNACQSYAELSPSTKGAHIIVKGSIPRGVKSPLKKIEMYDEARFFTMTGQAIRIAPIYEEQEFLTELFASIGKLKDAEGFDPADKPEVDDDETIYNRASNAINGDKFLKLWAGNSDGYPSDSEAHQALMNIIAFYTNNFAQCKRMFLFSKMSSHPKANRPKYLDMTVKRAFDQKAPTIEALTNMSNDFQKLLQRQKELAGNPETQPASQVQEGKGNNPPALDHAYNFSPPDTSAKAVLAVPPGVIRDASEFIYDAAYLQVREIALAGAVGLMAGICGRAFNVGGTGLNLYVTMLAPTGRGKEAISSGIEAIIGSMCMSNPLSDQIIGPTYIASGQALHKYIGKHPGFVSIIGEFDALVSNLHSARANDSMLMLRKNILEYYNKSGYGKVVRNSAYADSDNNTAAIRSPAMSIIGECTIGRMKAVVNTTMVESGFLPRLITFVYDGPRSMPNENMKKIEHEETGLIKKLVIINNTCMQITGQNRVWPVEMTEEALSYNRFLIKYMTDLVNKHSGDSVREELYNRCIQNIMRLAALCAIKVENEKVAWDGKMELAHIKWAASVVFASVNFWLSCFDNNEIGEQNNDIAQRRDIRKQFKKFFDLPTEAQLKYRASQQMVKDWVVPYRYIMQSTAGFSSFKGLEKTGGHAGNLKRVLQSLVESGEIVEISKSNNYNYVGLAYKIVAME